MRRVLPLAVVACLLVLPAAAQAAWSARAAGTAITRSDDMTNATGFTAACSARTATSTVALRWTPSPDAYVNGYSIVRSSSNGTTVTRTVTGRTTATYTDTVASPAGQTLTYTIQATTTTLWRTAATTATGRPSYTGSKNVCVTL